MFEIIDDYKNANSEEEKTEIFNDFCSSIWGSKNKRRIYNKQIKFKVRNDLLQTEIGKIFNTWSEIEYVGYKAMTKDTDWYNLIRQKINNLYTRYFDEDVILKKEYMDLLKRPKNLYYRWLNGVKFNEIELVEDIENSIYRANELKTIYKKQKMDLSWDEYKKVIEVFLKRIFDNCELIESYEVNNLTDKYIYEFVNEDNFYIKYICKSLEDYMLNYQKEYYGLKRGRNKKYKYCKECGNLIEVIGKNTQYCYDCKKEKRKETKRNWWNKNH